jgi:hypothetical protein
MRLTCVRNRGELAEGWYDPWTLQKARQSESAPADDARQRESDGARSPLKSTDASSRAGMKNSREDESDSDDSVGPTLPGQEARSRRNRVGPSIPNFHDLELKKGMVFILRSPVHVADAIQKWQQKMDS